MKTKIISATVALLLAIGGRAGAQTYDTNNDVVQTFAGFGIPGYVDGQGQLTAFSAPAQIASDTASNLFVWDSGNARIRKITANGTVTTFAGGGSYLNGYGTNASLSWGQAGAMVIDHANTLWLIMVSGYNGFPYLVTIDTNSYVSLANGGLTNLGASSGLCFDSANNLYYTGATESTVITPPQVLPMPWLAAGFQDITMVKGRFFRRSTVQPHWLAIKPTPFTSGMGGTT